MTTHFYKNLALRWALRRPGPDSYSDNDTNDFYYVWHKDGTVDDENFVLRSINGNVVSGLKYNLETQRFDISCERATDDLDSDKLSFYHVVGPIRVDTKGPYEFLISEIFRQGKRARRNARKSQSKYNKNQSFTEGRVEILKRMVELSIAENSDEVKQLIDGPPAHSTLDWFHRIYGDLAFGHPKYKMNMKRFTLIVSSLEEGRLLTAKDDGFAVTGKSLDYLETYETEEKKFKRTAGLQRAMNLLTFALFFVALLDLVLSFFDLR